MGPNDLRFKEMREYWQDAPADLSEEIRLAFKRSATYNQTAIIPGLFNEASSYELIPPVLLTTTIKKRFKKRRIQKTYKRNLFRVVFFCSMAMATYVIFRGDDETEAPSDQLSKETIEETITTASHDSIPLAGEKKQHAQPVLSPSTERKLTINDHVSPFYENDLLYTYIMYQLSDQQLEDSDREDVMELDEFSILKISPYTARLIRLSVKQNRQGELKRRARRILRKLEGIRKDESKKFTDIRASNYLNPAALASFIEGDH